MMNLRSMGAGSLPIPDIETYRASLNPGHFWCTLLTGAARQHRRRHRRTARRVWWRHATGATAPGGTFDYWHIHAEAMPDIEDWCGAWARKHLAGYTGMVNFETIGSRIIEAHLRFADQWPDLYGPGWVEALVRLYADGEWSFDDANRSDGYSVVLFGAARTGLSPSAAASARSRRAASTAYPACRSPSIRTATRRTTRCHRAASASRSINATDLSAGRRARDLLNPGLFTM